MASTVSPAIGTTPTAPWDDLRAFIAAAQEVDECRTIEGADWDLELSALTETTAELIPDPPALIFDRIKGYPPGYRVASLLLASYRRVGLALGLPLDRSKLEMVRLAARKLKAARPIPPVERADGPVLENVLRGDDVDLWRFPVPRFHANDGGRYLGTGCSLINRDPASGYVNVGSYRMQVHERNLLGLWMSPGQQGRLICDRYWQRGESCPVVATFGSDPVTFMASSNKIPWGQSELDYIGGLRGRPLEVIRGPLTGLPIPAHAEIAIEGEVPPPTIESRDEGPFGEWPGYYSGGTIGTGERQPVIRVKALYHRQDPIVVNDDIDPTDFKDVLWAMQTRVDPARDIELVDRCWSTPLDPRMSPAQRASGDHTNSRAIFYAVRPFEWRGQFPTPSRVDRALRDQMVEKYRDILPFPGRPR